jgi:hypothetical protein
LVSEVLADTVGVEVTVIDLDVDEAEPEYVEDLPESLTKRGGAAERGLPMLSTCGVVMRCPHCGSPLLVFYPARGEE